MEESQSLGKLLKTRLTPNLSLNKELRRYGSNDPQLHHLQSSYLTITQNKKERKSAISAKLSSPLQTMETLLRRDTNVEEQDNNENSEGQESDNDVIIKQENSTKKKDVRPEIVQGKDRKVTNRFTFTI